MKSLYSPLKYILTNCFFVHGFLIVFFRSYSQDHDRYEHLVPSPTATSEKFYPIDPKLFLSKNGPAEIVDQKGRSWIVGSASLAAYGSSFMALSDAWFTGYGRTNFHFVNDNTEWLQIDKAGHAWTAYNSGRLSTAVWAWTGIPHKKTVLIGGLSGFLYLLAIEWMDAHSEKYGWSWGDVSADIAGCSLFMSQELLWQQQRVQYKFSSHHKNYGERELAERANEVFGKSGFKRTLQDYNAQAYWFSANLKSFFKESKLPPWLNVSIGYGAEGMFGEIENKWIDHDSVFTDRTDIQRKRQFYLAPDVDFTKIKTNKKWLRTLFFCLNVFKCPAPALMLSKGGIKVYPVYF